MKLIISEFVATKKKITRGIKLCQAGDVRTTLRGDYKDGTYFRGLASSICVRI